MLIKVKDGTPRFSNLAKLCNPCRAQGRVSAMEWQGYSYEKDPGSRSTKVWENWYCCDCDRVDKIPVDRFKMRHLDLETPGCAINYSREAEMRFGHEMQPGQEGYISYDEPEIELPPAEYMGPRTAEDQPDA